MTMIEKVAAAIRIRWNKMGSYEDAAKAAIEAMREPNIPANLQDKWDECGQYIWESIIDAALEEK